MFLYHITTFDNLKGVLKHGVDPRKSQGKRRAIWIVDAERIPWALAHCSARHGVSVSQLAVVEADLPDSSLRRTRYPGVFWSPDRAIVNRWVTAGAWIEAQGWNDEPAE